MTNFEAAVATIPELTPEQYDALLRLAETDDALAADIALHDKMLNRWLAGCRAGSVCTYYDFHAAMNEIMTAMLEMCPSFVTVRTQVLHRLSSCEVAR
jgi:hypothetical protein